MTNERPIDDARCWFMNTADRAVDIYVNYHETPLTTIEPTEDQGVFTIDSDANRIYGTYTFEAREKDDPDGPPLAAVSVEFEEGDSYAAVFRRAGDADYELSVYENDFSTSSSSRFEIRHTGRPERIDWTLVPKEEADPRIPVDERQGTLERGEWQQAIDVIENEYRLEIVVDGEVVAFRQDLELELNRAIVVYLVDDPKPWMGSDEKEGHIFRQEYQILTGPDRGGIVTAPAEPYATTDTNRTIEFDFEPIEVYHTNVAESEIRATDPDGIVADLAIDDVQPDSDGFHIPDESIDRSYAIGGTTTGTLQVESKVPPATYDVRVRSNPDGLGEQVTDTVPVTVEPITVERLRNLVGRYHDDGAMTDAVANDLHALLDAAERSLQQEETLEYEAFVADLLDLIEQYVGRTVSRSLEDELDALLESAGIAPADSTDDACEALEEVITIVGEEKDEAISVTATVDLETETEALRKRLDCG